MRVQMTIVALIMVSAMVPAQVNVGGTVINGTDNTPVEMATVRLFAYRGADSTMVQGCQTTADGLFVMSSVAKGDYKLIISSVGFREVVRPIRVADKDVDMRVIRLTEDVLQLSEVNVQGHAAEMVVKGDTIEYNTAAYKVAENAMVEDLLKKMNGIQVDKEGNVTVNGESIKGVRIDGKKFFGDDVQSATKNIPAEMVDKIQVIDEKSDMAKLTGFEDDDTERIINLSLKQNRKKGLFGNYGGALGADMVTDNGGWFNYGDPAYGKTAGERTKHFFSNDFRYNANLFTNLLLGESQTTIIAGANNTNEIRSGRGRGPFSGQNSGVTWSENVGVNTNVDLNKNLTKIDSETSLAFGGDALMNHNYNDTRSTANKESYTGETTYHNMDSTTKFSNAWDVFARLEFEYQIDTLNKVLIQPRFNYTYNQYDSQNDFLYERDSMIINNGRQNQYSRSEDIGANVRVIYNHKFMHPGRALTLNAHVEFTNTKGNTETKSYDHIAEYYTVDQHTNNGANKLAYSLRASYVEPIYKTNHLIETSLLLRGTDRASIKDQYSMDSLSGQYVYDSVYSNTLDNHIYSEQLEANYRWVEKQFDLTLGARVVATQTHSTTYYGGVLNRDTMYNQWNWAPNVRFKYNFGRKEFARVIYRGNASQPSITQIEPVRNNSNALNETVGNMSLHSAYKHNVMIMYSRFNQDNFSSIMTGLRGTITKDALVNNSIYDETGKLYQQTINADAMPWEVGGDFMFNLPFCQKMFQLHSRTAASYNMRVAYILREQSAEEIERMISSGTLMRGDESRTGNLKLSEDLNIRFTHSLADVGVRGNVTYSRTQNSLNTQSLTNVLDWTVTGDITFHLPKAWNIQADCGYTARYGYTGLENVNEILLNASVDKTWGNGTLSLKVYDILNQKKNIVQVVSDNSVTYKQSNTLPTYFMLTFSYKLNRMGSLKAKGMGGFMQEMVESGGKPGGMPPMGPPPMN